ncbi:MAG: NTP transferase domain-containing protein [Phycisphaerales bacterium]
MVADKEDKYADLGLRTIADHNPGLGPLAGLQAALNDLREGQRWLLLCPCDAIVIKPDWVRQLIDARRRHGRSGVS